MKKLTPEDRQRRKESRKILKEWQKAIGESLFTEKDNIVYIKVATIEDN